MPRHTLGYQGWYNYKARFWFNHLQSKLSFRAKYVKPDLHKKYVQAVLCRPKTSNFKFSPEWLGWGWPNHWLFNPKYEKWFNATINTIEVLFFPKDLYSGAVCVRFNLIWFTIQLKHTKINLCIKQWILQFTESVPCITFDYEQFRSNFYSYD